MHWVVYLFGSGMALLVAATLLLVAIVPSIVGTRGARVRLFVALIGIVFLALSAAPLPAWCYAAIGMLLLGWISTLHGRAELMGSAHRAISIALLIAVVAMAGDELRTQFPARLAKATARHLDLIGDSLAAGVGGGSEHHWPELLARQHGIALRNYAVPGATLSTALRMASKADLADGVVLLEIGGNDVLAGTDVDEFERDLDSLLATVSGPGRQVVMFELPLPPLHNAYGLAQRRLAARHQVHLIPKRVLMGVLARQGATIDSLHLSPEGDQQLADAVWRELEAGF